ncbi:outer membrane lipoprotein A [Actinobacillus lignieresii]|uniref:transferrin-binding protein-like solute binding protein n=1 Tax=Actinobacillus lignieresii TaxID=720 RepID=UPI000E1197A3|nr:transferrin-binding protein-like solute binding protein [Actinobacillus lignieresii]SUU00415.1 outer membrane lipoprotein A [Actinobacillus lignieresii]
MNIATKLIAGLVASVVLTACSGGSSSSSAQPHTEPTPKTNMPAPEAEQPKKEEAPQADSPKAEKPKSIAPLMMENPKVEKQKENNLQEKSPKADEPQVMDPKLGAPQKDDQNMPAPEAEQPKKEEAPQADSPKVEKQKENNLQEKSPKADEPQVMDPKLGAPQKDDQKLEEPKNKSNAEILKELGIKDIKTGIITRSDVVLNLTLDEQENIQIRLSESDIVRNDLKITNTIPNQDIRTLKDSTGRLLGYYGYMQLNQVIEDERYGINNVDLVGHYLLSMDESTKTAPNKSIEYRGKMLYGYKNVDNRNLVADVQASYNHSDKKLSMEIFGDQGDYWKLGAIGNNRLPKDMVTGVVVDKDGTISNAGLYSKIDDTPGKLTPDANFSGGLFGKNGEVLAGKAEGINNNYNWQGVIGATATEANKK